MYVVEFAADKIPGVDSTWDTLHTFVRIPAGAMLAMSTVGDATPALELSPAIMGGGLAATSHATKSGHASGGERVTRAFYQLGPVNYGRYRSGSRALGSAGASMDICRIDGRIPGAGDLAVTKNMVGSEVYVSQNR